MSENKQEVEDLPSMDALEISKENKGGIKSIPTYFGGEDDDDIPDMEGFEDSDNLVESDPVNILTFFFYLSYSYWRKGK
jgi:ubiquitin-like-conjugating enzyme ATG3